MKHLIPKNPWQAAFSLTVLTIVLALCVTGNVAAAAILAPVAAADLEELAKEMKTATGNFESKRVEMEGHYNELKAKMEGGEKISRELKEAIDKILIDYNGQKTALDGVKAEFGALEQKMVATAREGAREEKSWGEQFIEGAQFKAASEGDQPLSMRRGMILGASVKAVTSATAGVGLIRSQRETEIVNLLRERQVVRDLLRTVPVSTSSVDYPVQTLRTNNAAPVAEALAKPYSDYAWEQRTVVVRVLAHLAKITRQAMDDAPRLVGEIDSELRYGLGFVEERQFLYGNGTGQNLHGIMPQATAFARPAGMGQFAASPGVTNVDVLRVAMLQNSLALLPADGIVLHEVNWAEIELLKTTDGGYLFANPQGTVTARMWGLPVIATPAMVAGDFLVGNFKLGATVYDRMGVEVLMSTENVDDFEKNLATMRCEERVAIAVKRPLAFTKGTFAAARAALLAA